MLVHLTQGLTQKSHRFILLHQHRSQSCITSISLYNESLERNQALPTLVWAS
uniref:Uncharacterized protein n=1 Tax=Arundo donax TaxID=35708 RepID=A0A0A9BT56_ARUDO